MGAGGRTRENERSWVDENSIVENNFRGKRRVWKRYAGMQTASHAWTKAAGKQKARSIYLVTLRWTLLCTWLCADQMMVIFT